MLVAKKQREEAIQKRKFGVYQMYIKNWGFEKSVYQTYIKKAEFQGFLS